MCGMDIACCAWSRVSRRGVFRPAAYMPACTGPLLPIARITIATLLLIERLSTTGVRGDFPAGLAFLTNWAAGMVIVHGLQAGIIGLIDRQQDSRDADSTATGSPAARSRTGGDVELAPASATATVPAAIKTPSTDPEGTAPPDWTTLDARRWVVVVAETALTMQVVVVVVFWTLLFDEADSHGTPYDTFTNISAHALL